MLNELFNNFWIIRESDREKYFEAKEALREAENFIYDKLGYKIISKPDFLKLEKIPSKAESWMGITEFKSKKEYIFLVILLMYLEKQEKYFQFILSELTAYIKENYLEEDIKWEESENRRYIIRILRFAEEIGIIKIEEFEESKFKNSTEGEALCTNTGLSRYFMRQFDEDISHYKGIEDFEKTIPQSVDEEFQIRVIRNSVYRELFNTPAVYRKDNKIEFSYLRNHANNVIGLEVEKYLGGTLHLHKNAAFIVYDIEKSIKHSIPTYRGISEIVLQLNKLILDKIKNKDLIANEFDIIDIPSIEFSKYIMELKDMFSHGWYKSYREEKSLSIVESEIKTYMEETKMIQEYKSEGVIHILPIVAKVIGNYAKGEENEDE